MSLPFQEHSYDGGSFLQMGFQNWLDQKKKRIFQCSSSLSNPYFSMYRLEEKKIPTSYKLNKTSKAFTFRGFCWHFYPKRLTTNHSHIHAGRQPARQKHSMVRGLAQGHLDTLGFELYPSGYQPTRSTYWATVAYSPSIFQHGLSIGPESTT